MGEPRRTTRFGALAALCITGVLIATGCASSEASPPPPPTTASSSPTAEKSDAAVLAAVLDVYTRYSAAFDVALSTMPTASDQPQLRATVTPEYWKVLEADLSSDSRTWYQTGSTAFENMSVVDSSFDSGEVSVSALVCVDSSHVTLHDQTGVEVHSDDRSLRFVMQVDFEGASIDELLVADAFSSEETAQCND